MTFSEHVRILLIEDNPHDAELLVRELRKASIDHSIRRVETEAAFRDALANSSPDIILADFNLPRFDGISALKIARRLVPDVPFIFVSGGIGEERAVQALREGATDYIIKDRLARLPAAVLRALDERRERVMRTRAQQALALSEERFHRASQATQEVICDWQLRSDMIWFSEALRTVWGYDLDTDEVPLSWWLERIHPDDRDQVMTSLNMAIESADRWSAEFRFLRGDGSYGVIFDRAVIMRDESGQARRLISALLDVSEQKTSEEMLQRSEQRFRSVAESARDAIVLWDTAGDVLFWNSGARRIFGYSAAEILTTNGLRIVAEDERRHWVNRRDAYLTTRDATIYGDDIVPMTGIRKDGTAVPIECSVTPWESGGEVYFTAILRDVTQRVQHEQEQRLTVAVSNVFSRPVGVQTATRELLAAIGAVLRASSSTSWVMERDSRTVHCALDLTEDPCGGQPHSAATARVVETVWTTGQPAAEALSSQPGMRAAAIPILEHGAVAGVLLFIHQEPAYTDAAVLSAGAALGRRIGEFFERARAEEQLGEHQSLFADAEAMARLGSWRFYRESGTLQFSEACARIFALDDRQMSLTDYLLRIVDRDDRARLQAALTPPYPDDVVALTYRATILGARRFIHWRFHVLPDNPLQLIGTAQDISEQVESVETIRELSRRNDLILENAAESILGLDRAGRITFANPATAKMTEWNLEELANASFHDVIHPQGCAPDCPLKAIPLEGSPRVGEDLCWRRSGVPFPVQYSLSPLADGDDIVGAVCVLEDLSERKRMESQIERSNRVTTLGRVAATIAHEFNNVLMGIQPFAEVIKRTGTDEKAKRSAAQILDSVSRGKRVTQEILRFTRAPEPARKPVDVKEWLGKAAAELRATLEPRVQVHVALPDDELWIFGDRAQLHQVVTNLALNARDAMPAGGKVTISGRRDNGFVILEVADTGSGIAPDVLPNIFEPLFTTKRTGTGLGLAVAQQIVERHGGTIQAESVLGAGTTFTIRLPRSEAGSRNAAPAPSTTPRVKRVLLVEDDPTVAEGLRLALEMADIEVVHCSLGSQAAPLLQSTVPDAVILDMGLPDMTGADVYDRLVAIRPEVPVLFSTGDADASALKRQLASSQVAFLHKPYDTATLLQTLDRIVPAAGPGVAYASQKAR